MHWLTYNSPTGEEYCWIPVLTELTSGVQDGLTQQGDWLIYCGDSPVLLTAARASSLLPLLAEGRKRFEPRLKRALAFKGFTASLAGSFIELLIECSLSAQHAPLWAKQGLAWLRGEERYEQIRGLLTQIIFTSVGFTPLMRQQAYRLLKRGVKHAITYSSLRSSG